MENKRNSKHRFAQFLWMISRGYVIWPTLTALYLGPSLVTMFLEILDGIENGVLIFILFSIQFILAPFCVGVLMAGVPHFMFRYRYEIGKIYSKIMQWIFFAMLLANIFFGFGGHALHAYILSVMTGFVLYPEWVTRKNEKLFRSMCAIFDTFTEEDKKFALKNAKYFLEFNRVQVLVSEGSHMLSVSTLSYSKFSLESWLSKPLEERVLLIPDALKGHFSLGIKRLVECLAERRNLLKEDSRIYAVGVKEDFDIVKRRNDLEKFIRFFKKKWGVDPDLPPYVKS